MFSLKFFIAVLSEDELETNKTHHLCTFGPGLCLNDEGAPLVRVNKHNSSDRCLYGVASHSMANHGQENPLDDMIAACQGRPPCGRFSTDVFSVPHVYLRCHRIGFS